MRREGQKLSPRQAETVRLREQHPDATWPQIADMMGISLAVVEKHWQIARQKLGSQVLTKREVDKAVREIKRLDRASLAGKLSTFVDALAEEFMQLDAETLEEMVKKRPKDMAIVIGVMLDKIDKLEDRPLPPQEHLHVHRLDQAMQMLLEEARRRGNTIDITPYTSTDRILEAEVLSSE